MNVTYQSRNFQPSDIVASYIAYDAYGLVLKQYDVNIANRTIRESVVNPTDYRSIFVDKAYSLRMQAFKQVKVS
jgi:hypothetical protein